MSTHDRPSNPEERPPRRIVVRRASAAPPSSLPEQAPPPAPAPTLVYPAAAPPTGVGAPAPARRGINWLGIGCLLTVVVCLVIVAVPVIMGVDILSRIGEGINYMVAGIQSGFQTDPVARVTGTQTVINSIQPLGQVVSVEMQLAKANMSVDIRQGLLNACSFSASYVAQGAVEAGIDLTRIGPDDINYNGLTDTYTLTLPPPQLTGCRIDLVDQYNESVTLCVVDWDSARQLGQYIALNEFRDDALESNILGRAQQQTTLVIGNFVRSLTGSNVTIVYREDAPGLPPSCLPDPPDVWSYDPAQEAWVSP